MPLSPSSIIWYWPVGIDTFRLRKSNNRWPGAPESNGGLQPDHMTKSPAGLLLRERDQLRAKPSLIEYGSGVDYFFRPQNLLARACTLYTDDTYSSDR